MMSDRFAVSFTIGGRLKRSLLPELLEVVQETDVSIEWGDAPLNPQSEQELLAALDEGQLWFCDDQALNGEFPELETACRELGLSYTRQSEGYSPYDAEVVDWRPGMTEPMVRIGSNSSDGTFVPTEEVRKVLTHLEASNDIDNIDRARELLRKLCPDIPVLLPFKIT